MNRMGILGEVVNLPDLSRAQQRVFGDVVHPVQGSDFPRRGQRPEQRLCRTEWEGVRIAAGQLQVRGLVLPMAMARVTIHQDGLRLRLVERQMPSDRCWWKSWLLRQ